MARAVKRSTLFNTGSSHEPVLKALPHRAAQHPLLYIMQMNQQWMYGDRRTSEYITGLQNFIVVANANRDHNGFMCCPCVHCQNKKDYSNTRTIHAHLLRSGFMPSYNCWTKHGEKGVVMEDNKEEEDDDNYHNMYPEYDDNARS